MIHDNPVIKNLRIAMARLGHGNTEETLELLARLSSEPLINWRRIWRYVYKGNRNAFEFRDICQGYLWLPRAYRTMKDNEKAKRERQKAKSAAYMVLHSIQRGEQTMKPSKKYMVVNTTVLFPHTGGGRVKLPFDKKPAVLHTAKRSAEDEATRLAKENPGQTFEVFATTSAFITEDPVTKYTY